MRTPIAFSLFAILTLGSFTACGPGARNNGDDGSGDANSSTLENTPELCSDGLDNNSNGLVDCADPTCSGIGTCPVCGMVEHPTGQPIDLPDGICGTGGDGVCTCSTNADCTSLQPAGQTCFDIGSGEKECRQSYTSKVTFTGFGQTQTIMSPSDILSVCVNISHEWVRDLDISLIAPSGQIFELSKFEGRDCPPSGDCEVFLGHPLNTDGDCSGCTPEAGLDYCWKPTATNPTMLGYADASSTMQSWADHDVLPPGDYASSDPWTSLIGAQLNGAWTFSVTDLWEIDAGKIHSWSIAFNPMIVKDCSGPVIQ